MVKALADTATALQRIQNKGHRVVTVQHVNEEDSEQATVGKMVTSRKA